MGARSKARRRALDLLYAADMRGESALASLEEQIAEGEPPNNAYTATLIRGVAEYADRIDALLTEYSTDWTIDRMPAVDRNVLRLGVWELLWGPDDVPGTVAVSEAMGLVRELSTDESPPFVNGILGAIQRNRESLV